MKARRGKLGEDWLKSFGKCPSCNEYAFLSDHHCPPRWLCRLVEWEDGLLVPVNGEDESTAIFASSADVAAERFAREYDFDGVIACEGAYVLVQVTAADGSISYWSVCCELVPHYSAHEVRPARMEMEDPA